MILFVLQAAMATYGVPVPLMAMADDVIKSSPDFLRDLMKQLDEIAPPDPSELMLADAKDPAQINDCVLLMKNKSRGAVLAVKEIFGEIKTLSECGLVKRIAKDGRVVWILDEEPVLKAFDDMGGAPLDFTGKSPDQIYEDFKAHYASPVASQASQSSAALTTSSSNMVAKKSMWSKITGK